MINSHVLPYFCPCSVDCYGCVTQSTLDFPTQYIGRFSLQLSFSGIRRCCSFLLMARAVEGGFGSLLQAPLLAVWLHWRVSSTVIIIMCKPMRIVQPLAVADGFGKPLPLNGIRISIVAGASRRASLLLTMPSFKLSWHRCRLQPAEDGQPMLYSAEFHHLLRSSSPQPPAALRRRLKAITRPSLSVAALLSTLVPSLSCTALYVTLHSRSCGLSIWLL